MELVAIAKGHADRRQQPLRIMFEDESRFGRMNRPMRCWAPKGYRPVVGKQLVREYTYAFCAASPSDGVSDFLMLPALSQQATEIFLEEVSARHSNEIILMIYDGASAHGEGIKLPKNMILAKLPPYSPELNPVEHIWDDMREKFFGNFVFKSMNAVEEQIIKACQFYENNAKTTQSLIGFDWIVNSI